MLQRIKMTTAAELGGVKIPEGAFVELDLERNSIKFNGQRLELGLTTADVHDPTEMPTYLAGYSNEEFRHQDACQVILVDKDEDKYRTFDSDAAFTPVKVKTDDDSYPSEVKVTSSLTNYKVVVRRLAAFVSDTVASQVSNPGYDVKYIHLERAARAINMDLEIDVLGASGLLTSSGNWTSGYSVALAAGFQWNGGVNSDPVADIRGRVNKSAQRITKWILNQRLAGVMLDNPKVRDYTRFKMGDASLDAMIKAVFDAEAEATLDFKIAGLGTFMVCCAKAKDTTGAIDYIMPDVLVGITQPSGTPTNGEKIATSYNFRRRGPAGNGFNTKEVRIEQRGVGGTLLIAEEASIPTMTGTIVGGLVTGCVQ
jgi:hypothetical protein